MYRLTFATGPWFDAEGVEGFYPEVAVVCTITEGAGHYHVPLLISPYAFSTYRGS
jgi:5-hydroxyisourate hydrolase